MTLDAYEAALNANPRSDHRHRIEHAVISTKDATQRIKDLGVVIQSNPTFIRMSGDYYEQLFTKKQMDRVFADREWLDAGIPLAYGSDAPTAPWYKPQITIAAGMARVTLSGKVINREQELTFQEALRACTMGAAYVAHEENIKGSIEIGKLADIAVWSQDPTGATPKELFDLPDMFMTIIGGKIVH